MAFDQTQAAGRSPKPPPGGIGTLGAFSTPKAALPPLRHQAYSAMGTAKRNGEIVARTSEITSALIVPGPHGARQRRLAVAVVPSLVLRRVRAAVPGSGRRAARHLIKHCTIFLENLLQVLVKLDLLAVDQN